MPTKKAPRSAAAVQADLDKVNARRDEDHAKAKKLAAELDTARAYEAAQARVADMPAADRAALAQVIAASGVDASHKVGVPGNEED